MPKAIALAAQALATARDRKKSVPHPALEWRAVPRVQRQVEPFARFVDEPPDLGQIIAKLLFVRD
jgi:hypothetical protein